MTQPHPRPRTRIAVLFGGPSGEHDVSCASAASIVRHLDRSRFEVTPVRVTRDGVWVVGKDDPEQAELDQAALVKMTAPDGVGFDRAHSLAAAVEALNHVDVAFPAFHGRYGEDGTVQSLLELVGVPYVGNGVAASAVGMDKEWTKTLLRSAGLTVAPAVVLSGDETGVSAADRARLGLPVFVKPAREGSSIGVTKVDDWTELDDAVALARRSDAKVLVESAILGREIDIGVLQYPDGRVACGPPLEIRLEHEGFFDFAAKYQNTRSALHFPTDLDPEVVAMVHDQASRIFRLLGCSGLLRVDFFLRQDGDRTQPVVNEVNTFPGFSARSQYPQMWQTAGMAFPELLSILVDTALATVRPGPTGR